MEDGLEGEIEKSKLRLVTPASQVGSDLTERYRLVDLIGSGATSSVFEGYDKESERRVAIKALHAHLADKQDVVERFEREAKTAASLNHPNIVRIFERTSTGLGQPLLIMEFVEGQSLHDLMRSCGGSLPTGRAINIFLQIAGALAAAHEKRIVHRDLKPQNIMVDTFADDSVKVLDFGIAKALGPQGETFFKLTQSGDTLGSLLYMSPEQCLDEDVDERSDIYSLGCLMYEALTGKPPLSGRTAFETMNAQLSQKPVAFRTVRPEQQISRTLEKIVFKSMEKRPGDRFQSVSELIEQLQAAKAHDSAPIDSDSKHKLIRFVDEENELISQSRNLPSDVKKLPALNFAEELNANIQLQELSISELVPAISITNAFAITCVISIIAAIAGLYPHGKELLAIVAGGVFLLCSIMAKLYLKYLVRTSTNRLESIKKNLRFRGLLNDVRLLPKDKESAKSVFEVELSMKHKNGHRVLYKATLQPQRELSEKVWRRIATASEFSDSTDETRTPLPTEVVVFFDDATNRPVACSANGAFADVVSCEDPELEPWI